MKFGPPDITARGVAWRIGIAMTLLFALTAGGRITSSDEYTMYRLTEALVTHGQISVVAGNAEPGVGGKLYPKAALGQALAAAPFYALGRVAAAPFPAGKRELVTRAVTSLVNAAAGGLLAAVLFLLFLELGAAPRAAFFWTCATCLATPLWVYAKSFLTEPLIALGLAAGLYGALRFRSGGAPRHAALAGLGWGFAFLVKYAVAPAILVLALPFLPSLKRVRAALPGVLVALVFLATALAYNAARTGNPLASGYGRQGTLDAFSTPIFVGLYGLLLSSGKGIVWFAPLTVLVPGAVWPAVRRLRAPAIGIAAACALMTLVYASFEHWAGDGSWGPRYLVPFVPLAIALVVAAHAQEPWGGGVRRAVVAALFALGVVVQLGGVGVYFGAQMREAGDYPYTRALSDPRFMEESHFNPRFSPIAAHWRMLARNASLFAAGRGPRLDAGTVGAGTVAPATAGTSSVESERLAVPASQVDGLTKALDFWWAYAIAAGLPRLPVLGAAVFALLATAWAFGRAVGGVRSLEVRPLPQAPDTWLA